MRPYAVVAVKEKHEQSMKRLTEQQLESKSKTRKASAVAKREQQIDLDAARGAAARGNRWAVVVERHRNLRKVGLCRLTPG